MIKNLEMRIEIKEEILGKWKEDSEEAEQKMMKAKSKQTVKKWSRRLQVCGMNIRELERNIKNLKGEKKVKVKRVWGYQGVSRSWGEYRAIGAVTKKYFIERISAEDYDSSENWIRERIAETGNKVEVELANSEVGTIFILKIYGFNVDTENIVKRLK